jgi:hypothetical protein
MSNPLESLEQISEPFVLKKLDTVTLPANVEMSEHLEMFWFEKTFLDSKGLFG